MQFTIATIAAMLAISNAAPTTNAAPVTERDLNAPLYPDLLPGAVVSYHCTEAAPCGTPMDPAAHSTYYNINGGTTACGQNDPLKQYTTEVLDDKVDDFIALSVGVMGDLSSGPGDKMNPVCNQMITVTNLVNGKTMTVPVKDKCPDCASNVALDMSEHMFLAMGGTIAAGTFDISWHWA